MNPCYQRCLYPCSPCSPSNYCNEMVNEYCNVRQNRSCCDCFPTRCPPPTYPEVPKKKFKCSCSPSRPPPACKPKRNRPKDDAMYANFREAQACYSASKSFASMTKGKSMPSQIKDAIPCPFRPGSKDTKDARKRDFKSFDTKQTKNKQNFQYQDMLGKKRMEVINEEQEGSDDECYCDDPKDSRKIQDSCADFLSIVHDTVLETVQKSVETILRDYFMHTMEKIECLCSQMMRNECLLSKMYLDVLDKISTQSEKSLRQFKCLCQFLAECRDDDRPRPGDKEKKCNCHLINEEALSQSKDSNGRGRRNSCCLRRMRDSDTETKTLSATEGSLTSCTAPTLHPKPKDGDTSNTSITEQVRQVSHVITEYQNAKPRESAQRGSYSRPSSNKYISVKSGPSDVDMSQTRI